MRKEEERKFFFFLSAPQRRVLPSSPLTHRKMPRKENSTSLSHSIFPLSFVFYLEMREKTALEMEARSRKKQKRTVRRPESLRTRIKKSEWIFTVADAEEKKKKTSRSLSQILSVTELYFLFSLALFLCSDRASSRSRASLRRRSSPCIAKERSEKERARTTLGLKNPIERAMASLSLPVSSPAMPSSSSPAADLDNNKKNKNVGWNMALAGALSGAASRTLVAPFDRVKLLAQVAAVPGSLSTSASASSPSSSPSLSPLSSPSSSPTSCVATATARRSTAATLRAIYEADGVRGLFRGNVAALLRTIPYSAVQLSTHDLLKRSLATKVGKTGGGGGEASSLSTSASTSPSSSSAVVALPTGARLAAAAGAGVAAAAVSHPLDTLRLRLALPTATATASAASSSSSSSSSRAAAAALASSSSSSSLISTAATVIRTEGFLSLYRGLSAAVLGAAPFSAISLMTFDRLQSLAAARRRREWSEKKSLLLQREGEQEGEGEEGLAPEAATAAAATTMAMFLPAAASSSSSSPALSPPPPPQAAPAWEAALAGAFAGAVASTATYPIDTLRRRLQLPTSTSVAGCVGVVPEVGSAESAAAAAASAAAAKADSLRSSHTRSLFSAAATAIRHDGFFSLYRGWVVGEKFFFFFLPFPFFLSFERFRKKVNGPEKTYPSKKNKNKKTRKKQQAAASWPRSSA